MSTDTAQSRAWVEVDLANLVANARRIRDAAGGARLLPMVKANAYGTGVLPVVEVLETLDPWGYGVATVAEGEELRDAGVRRPLIVFTPAREADFPELRRWDLRPVLDAPRLIEAWGGPFHLEVDTGMGRAGIPWWDTDRLSAAFALAPEGVFTHFHSADEAPDTVVRQEQRFRDVLSGVSRPSLVHAGNSAGAFGATGTYDLVRPGIYLYGGAVGPAVPAPEPVVSVRSHLVSCRTVRPGDTVSYGATWSADRETTVGTLAIGYADGVRRSVQGRARVLLQGRRYPVVGRVTMDMTMVDLGPGPAVEVGAEATLIGRQGAETISLEEMADWAGTITYEVLTGLGTRLPRVYVGR